MALLPIQESSPQQSTIWQVLSSFGFRVFFLLAGLMAVVVIPVWLVGINGWPATLSLQHYGSYWHGHEMMFGYTAAVVAGFLLTAAKNWTGQHTVIGKKLLALGGCWLLARTMIWVDVAPLQWLGIFCDLIFLPLLVYFVARPILAAQQQRNYIFPVLLAAMTIAHIVMHMALFYQKLVLVQQTLHFALFIIMTIMVTMACRVVPFFTERGLNLKTPLLRDEKHDLWCAITIGVAGLAYVLMAGWLSSLLLSIAAVTLFSRTYKWYQPTVWRVPLLWVLHVGMLWLEIGLLLLALQSLQLSELGTMGSSPIHALTTGCIGLMTLGMMSRVSLGHSGRPLQTVTATHWAFILLNVAALIRVFGAWFLSSHYLLMVTVAGLLWTVAFLLFLWVYVPIFVTASK
jgi:uncharacterized protein involved in response to NO